MTSTPAPAPARDFAALTGAGVTEAHARYCREHGHATHTVDGEVQPHCPRCGDLLDDEDDAPGCEGHESLRGDAMGASVFCPNDECVRSTPTRGPGPRRPRTNPRGTITMTANAALAYDTLAVGFDAETGREVRGLVVSVRPGGNSTAGTPYVTLRLDEPSARATGRTFAVCCGANPAPATEATPEQVERFLAQVRQAVRCLDVARSYVAHDDDLARLVDAEVASLRLTTENVERL